MEEVSPAIQEYRDDTAKMKAIFDETFAEMVSIGQTERIIEMRMAHGVARFRLWWNQVDGFNAIDKNVEIL